MNIRTWDDPALDDMTDEEIEDDLFPHVTFQCEHCQAERTGRFIRDDEFGAHANLCDECHKFTYRP